MRQQGFTLVELIVVMLVMSVLAAYVGTRWSFGDATVSAQAEQLARDLRHAQMLAMQQGQTLRLESTGGGYRVTDGAGVIIDPATHEGFIQTLDNGVSLSGGPVEFDSMGRPVSGGSLAGAAVSFSLSGDSDTAAVNVAPVTGFVSGP